MDSTRRRRSIPAARVGSGPARPPGHPIWWQRKQPGPWNGKTRARRQPRRPVRPNESEPGVKVGRGQVTIGFDPFPAAFARLKDRPARAMPGLRWMRALVSSSWVRAIRLRPRKARHARSAAGSEPARPAAGRSGEPRRQSGRRPPQQGRRSCLWSSANLRSSNRRGGYLWRHKLRLCTSIRKRSSGPVEGDAAIERQGRVIPSGHSPRRVGSRVRVSVGSFKARRPMVFAGKLVAGTAEVARRPFQGRQWEPVPRGRTGDQCCQLRAYSSGDPCSRSHLNRAAKRIDGSGSFKKPERSAGFRQG